MTTPSAPGQLIPIIADDDSSSAEDGEDECEPEPAAALADHDDKARQGTAELEHSIEARCDIFSPRLSEHTMIARPQSTIDACGRREWQPGSQLDYSEIGADAPKALPGGDALGAHNVIARRNPSLHGRASGHKSPRGQKQLRLDSPGAVPAQFDHEADPAELPSTLPTFGSSSDTGAGAEDCDLDMFGNRQLAPSAAGSSSPSASRSRKPVFAPNDSARAPAGSGGLAQSDVDPSPSSMPVRTYPRAA